MKIKKVFLIYAIFIFVVQLMLVSAEVKVGNQSFNIDTSYGPSQQITGWINISIKNESADSLLLYSNQSVTLKEFLDRNTGAYSCVPIDCQSTYSVISSESTSKELSIQEGFSKIIGIRFIESVSSITDFSFNVSTNAGRSCLYPLKIDVLNDGLYDWKADSVSDEQCYIENPYGCFQAYYAKNLTPIISDGTSQGIYCEKTRIPPVKWFKIGAKVNGTGNVDFKFSIKTSSGEQECAEPVTATGSGEISCILKLEEDLDKFTDAEICMKAEAGGYAINYEDIGPCGYSQVGSDSASHDFEIFVYPLKYESVTYFKFDQDLVGSDSVLATKLSEYISNRYRGNCTPECIIPIKITSGINQKTSVYGLKLDYISQSLSNTKNRFYEVNKSSPIINLDFRKLDLGKANFLTPSGYGQTDVSIRLGNKEILRQNISIKQVPKVYDVLHSNAAALVPTTFYVYMENISNATSSIRFDWDFGDGDKQTTSSKMAKHTYLKVGTYDVSVKVIKEWVGNITKTVKVSVSPPKDAAGALLKQDINDLTNISSSIESFPLWIRTEILKRIDTEDIKAKIKVQEENYKQAIGEEYTKVMQDILNIKIPYNVKTSQKINNMLFIPNREQFSLTKLESIQGAEPAEESEEITEKYFMSINNWLSQKANITFQSETYSAYYRDGDSDDILSYVKVIITPYENMKDIYIIINGDPDSIKFNDETDLKTRQVGEDAIGVMFLDMGSEVKTVEFLYPGKISAAALPFFISPDLSEVEIVTDIGKCNHDGKCDSGEDSKNCRSDCKPWGWTLLLLIILIIIALIIYIALQEWYKKRYEAYLFKDKNQLFNLINFMNNASLQKQSKSQIFLKLKEYKWTNEQLEFAWRKLRGLRTGLWEIPLFKWREKKQVKQELDKRKQGPIALVKPGTFRPGQGPMQPKK